MNWFAREMELKAEGFEKGREEESRRYSAMVRILLDANRIDDLLRAAEDDACRAKLYSELGLE